ncbi:MAG TPA: hypothetical protein VGS97_16855 [Actinocrinis sp.]|uniref:hypothetical protein n=1 Tax=Actinocrinis sp. TaxID=1920516 RepID=UPI002DDCF0D3|nr:hypothetical protein [Actinocrinis sp.]HEV2345772.1 hypothetical protein [Actinocrinis sp.]
MKLTDWRILSDRGPDLIACLDFPGARAAAGFTDLAEGVPVDACFLHFRQAGADPLAASVDRWVAEFAATGRPVRAVLGYCAGGALATRLADAIAATGPAPVVVLFDAEPTTGESIADQFRSAVQSSARHLTASELADADALSEQLVARYPDDPRPIAAGLTEHYETLMRAVADRLSLPQFLHQELTAGFTAYLDYLLLAGEGGFDTRATTPLFVTSIGHEPPVQTARTVSLDVDHDDLLRDPKVYKLVAEIIRGETPQW